MQNKKFYQIGNEIPSSTVGINPDEKKVKKDPWCLNSMGMSKAGIYMCCQKNITIFLLPQRQDADLQTKAI